MPYTDSQARARLATFGKPEYPPCETCGAQAGAMPAVGDARQGEAFCGPCFRVLLDGRYAAMGRPVTAVEKARRVARGVRV